ncbi:hypothetical protein F5X99DRAFT_426030 [Biscogniauxia marginata]|nr:hypothetical protein F5X99DRAFT_426030 [Biscogniauxia marginata]
MNFLRKGRNPDDRSTSSLSKQYLLESEGEDDNNLYIPGNKTVYVTQTKDGKPAFGRKKGDKLLQGYGFDMLGQSLGIPSRMDFERQSRHVGMASQNPGILTTAETPCGGRPILKPGNDYHTHVGEYPLATGKTRSMRSSSMPVPVTPYQPNTRANTTIHHDHVSGEASPYLMSEALYPPPPPPPPQPAHLWNTQPMMNGMSFMAPGYNHTANQPAHPLVYPPQVTHGSGPFSWPIPQFHQYGNPLGLPVPQSTSMPLLPQQQYPANYQPAGRTLHATHIPPPPPPPPFATQPQGLGGQSGNDYAAKLVEEQPKDLGERGGPAVGMRRETRTRKRYEDSLESKLKERERVSRRIRHIHICAGCGKKRSKEYQRAHPLKRGEIPEPDYCYRCIRDAAMSDTESSSSYTADDASFIQYVKEAPVSGPSTDESRVVEKGKYVHGKTRRGSRWMRKSRRLSLLSGMLSSAASSKNCLKPPKSISSAEESRSRASSPALGPSVSIRSEKRSGASVNRNQNKSKESTPLPQASVSTRSLQRPVDKIISTLPMTTSCNKSSSPATSRIHGRRSERRMLHEPVGLSIPSIAPQREGVATSSTHGGQKERAQTPRQADSQASSKAPSAIPSKASYIVSTGNYSQVPCKVSSTSAENMSGPPSRGVTSAEAPRVTPIRYKQPSIRNEASEIAAEAYSSTRHETRDNLSNRHDPCQGTFEAQPRSSERSTPKWKSVPLTGDNNGSRFGNWPDAYFPEPGSPYDPKYTSKWEEPPTPDDLPQGGATAFPFFMRDSWSHVQSDIEREAEEMAERDLAAAGKRFGGFGSSWGGSATSSFPFTSSLTRSVISIESCDSNEDRTDGNIAYEMAEASEAEETVRGEEKSIKKLEFSSEDDQHQKTAAQRPMSLSSERSAHIQKSQPVLLNQHARSLYDNNDDRSDVSSDILPPLPGSSLLAHTGHSIDDLAMNYNDDEQTNDATSINGTRRRLRRFVRL